jgi:hypothetical protein
MEKKIIEWFRIESELSNAKTYPGWPFQVWCTINEKKIKDILDEVRKKSTPGESYSEFLKKAEEIKVKFCEKTTTGEPDLEGSGENRRYKFSEENKKDFDKEITKLNKENESIIAEYSDMINKYLEYITTDSFDIDIKLLNSKNIPEEYFQEHPDKSLSFLNVCLDLVNIE